MMCIDYITEMWKGTGPEIEVKNGIHRKLLWMCLEWQLCQLEEETTLKKTEVNFFSPQKADVADSVQAEIIFGLKWVII